MKLKPSIFITALIMVTIFIMSSDDKTQSKDKSDFVINLILHIINRPELKYDEAFLSAFGYFVRKAAHFSAYFALGISMFCTLKDYLSKLPKLKLFMLSLLLCFIYAGSDEIHQIFSHRGAMFSDVLLDTAGSLTGLTVIVLLKYIFESRQKNNGQI